MTEFTKEQLTSRAQFMVRKYREMLSINPDYDGIARDVELFVIALAALTTEPEVWEIENPGEGTFYSAHPPRDFEKASCVYYRLQLLEGLK